MNAPAPTRQTSEIEGGLPPWGTDDLPSPLPSPCGTS